MIKYQVKVCPDCGPLGSSVKPTDFGYFFCFICKRLLGEVDSNGKFVSYVAKKKKKDRDIEKESDGGHTPKALKQGGNIRIVLVKF